MKLDLEAIKVAAQNATPGQWFVSGDDPIYGAVGSRHGDETMLGVADEVGQNDVTYMTTVYPEVALAMVKSIEDLQKALRIAHENIVNAYNANERGDYATVKQHLGFLNVMIPSILADYETQSSEGKD